MTDLSRKFVADFETTTDENDCRVWAFAICSVDDSFSFQYGNDLEVFMQWCANTKENYTVSFHNLKFDSAFILSWLNKNGFTRIADKKDKADKTYTTLISDMGAYYQIEVFFKVDKKKVNKVTFNDSMKIFNMSVEKIAKDFNLPIRKLEIDYKAFRPVGHILTPEEVDYIRNDVEIVARALNIFYKQGHTKLTIGSNALTSFKSMCRGFNNYFPVLEEDQDNFIRKGYRGGFTYVNPKHQGKTVQGNCICLDVNSLYPSRLVQCHMPYGQAVWFDGQYQTDKEYPLYVQRLVCFFELKKDKIPSIQIKNTARFIPNEYLASSGGEAVELTLTNVDLKLFFEQYEVDVAKYLGGYKFKACKGLFNQYIDYWTEEKTKAKKEQNGAKYSISKLFMNSLYGKFATSKTGSQKIPVFDNNGVLHYITGEPEEMKSVYLPVAVFTTSYGRYLTITTSQKIRDWTEKNLGFDGYLYSDTDSCYVKIELDQLEEFKKSSGIQLDPYILGAWDVEQDNITRFKALRQKCYIKEIDGKIHATVAGCPKNLSRLFNFKNFRVGFTTSDFSEEELGKDSKLRYKQVKGGVILKETDFTIK